MMPEGAESDKKCTPADTVDACRLFANFRCLSFAVDSDPYSLKSWLLKNMTSLSVSPFVLKLLLGAARCT
jgi:hypothetical protein